ncbi:Receptor-like protein 38 [Sesamum angolense]|uniref:Receptor-like protein 38 n=1 Tax=Sesamum angolense TaxID=2727404 RepID=A0AAE1W0V7_9LAMI|nr:Receptor-like protein 38 [Sesamum angolense]
MLFSTSNPSLSTLMADSLLGHLRYLNLSGNDFEYAPIPEFIGSLTKLRHLDLVWANFGGPIPHQIGNLSKLHFLDISMNHNCYSENLDWVFRLDSLEHLDLSTTNLTKATNWLEAVSKLTSIKELYLSEFLLQLISVITAYLVSFNDFEYMMSLEHLSLEGNDLQGGIPKHFGNLSSLSSLTLSHNNLTGDISKVMMNLSIGPLEKKLEYLDLDWNKFSGTFPNMSRFSSLDTLHLDGNNLSGSIREGYLRLPHLATLDLSSNKLIGPIPDLSFSSSLVSLQLSNNMFNGTLTETIGRLSQLRVLDLSFNYFLEVQFSPSWVPRFQLERLLLTECKLGKYFPKWLETQKELSWIEISSTGISDIIPSWFGSIPNDTYMYMNASDNQIYGLFPNFSLPLDSKIEEIILDISGNMISGSLNFLCDVKEWVFLDLSDNLFSGQIPDCFANCQNLTILNLANNHFSGKIPDLFGQLNALTLLNLRNNSLSGGILTTMRNCRHMKMIDLGENRLTGNIPSWIGDSFPKLIVLILRCNELYGDIPSNICRLPNLQILDISSNKNISGAIPECLQDYVAMSTKQFLDDDIFVLPKNNTRVYIKGLDSFKSPYFMWKGKELKYTSYLDLVKLIDFSDNSLVGKVGIGEYRVRWGMGGGGGCRLELRRGGGGVPPRAGRTEASPPRSSRQRLELGWGEASVLPARGSASSWLGRSPYQLEALPRAGWGAVPPSQLEAVPRAGRDGGGAWLGGGPPCPARGSASSWAGWRGAPPSFPARGVASSWVGEGALPLSSSSRQCLELGWGRSPPARGTASSWVVGGRSPSLPAMPRAGWGDEAPSPARGGASSWVGGRRSPWLGAVPRA